MDVALFGVVIGSGPGAGPGTCVSGAAPALVAFMLGPEFPLRVEMPAGRAPPGQSPGAVHSQGSVVRCGPSFLSAVFLVK